ncbi:hypothetical protein E2C01_072538 [Portunus trituberculatus]|uniref:Uncharacterized protein n=1 Tax=Portunus trituberculatus TaxID=210409 RepID=A0A5B7IBL0_PORTR|nr:hypothetical protein [Portunus trituberculatus]
MQVLLASCFPPPTSLSPWPRTKQPHCSPTHGCGNISLSCPVFTMALKHPSASPAGGDTPDTSGQPQRVLTAANLSQCMDLLVQSMKILEEINPNIERSTTVIRGVMEKNYVL